jgi:hypothetical protein|tara:strand:- start:31 stop:360 length:330 start_codon:yes stop_codon:yes gene_type:complete
MPEKYLKGFTSASKNILKNEAILAVLSASIVAPFIIPKINSLLDEVEFTKQHKSITSFLAGLAIFSIAGTIGGRNVYVRAIVIGVAGAFILSSLLPIYTSLTSKSSTMP